MSESTINRAGRRRAAIGRAKTTTVAAAAAAMALGLAAAPAANAVISVDLTVDPTYTAGTVAALINFIPKVAPGLSIAGGLFNSGPPPSINASITQVIAGYQAVINATLNLRYVTPSDTTALYNLLGAIPNPTCAGSYASNCRYPVMLGTFGSTLNLANAYRTQIDSVTTGNTPAGFIPFQPSPQSTDTKPTQTNQLLVFLQNSLRANGGIAARFPDISKALGINPEMPAGGRYASTDKRTVLNTTTIDATWAYDPITDFPAVFNATAIANSFFAGVPINLLGGVKGLVISDGAGNAVSVTDIGLNIAGLLQVAVPGTPIGTITLPMVDGKSYYVTIEPNELPLLTPVRLPGLGINAVLSALNSPYLLGNPFADAIEPALKILTNIAYTDVVTPSEGGTYNRTFLTGGVTTPFGSVDPLTPEEKQAVPGDLWHAFVDGVQAQVAKPFWGIIVPNPANPPAGAATPAATVKAAAATLAPDASPVVAEQVSVPAVAPQMSAPVAAPVETPADPVAAPSAPVADPAPEVEVSAPVADPALPVQVSGPAEDSAPAPGASSHSRGASAGSDSSSGSGAAASTGRHRGAA